MEIRPAPDGTQQLFVKAPEWDATFNVWGACPVQAFGTVDGRDLYFRARHGEWSFEVSDAAGNLPSDGDAVPGGFRQDGVDPHNGYMPLSEAVNVITGCLKEYATQRLAG